MRMYLCILVLPIVTDHYMPGTLQGLVGGGGHHIDSTCLEPSCNRGNQIITIQNYNCYERAIHIVLWIQQTRKIASPDLAV